MKTVNSISTECVPAVSSVDAVSTTNKPTDKRLQRKKATAEDFTPISLVNQMLDKLLEYAPNYFTDPSKTFLDPACGNGNMLVCVLQRKLDNNHDPLQALKTIFGCDIMKDNIAECRKRLLTIVQKCTPITFDHIKAVFQNIVWTSLASYPNGSLDYDFNFPNKVNLQNVQEWLDKINAPNSTFLLIHQPSTIVPNTSISEADFSPLDMDSSFAPSSPSLDCQGYDDIEEAPERTIFNCDD